LIQLLVLDVDGCLTDGGICYTENGDEFKTFSVKDGLAIASWIKMGKDVAIITGRSSNIVKRRATELGIKQIHQGVKDKRSKLKDILLDLNLTLENVAAIGDDLNDYAMLKSVKKSFTPNDGVDDIKDIADITLCKNGGDGAIREMIEIVLKDEDIYEDFLNLWR
jgi:3-deoxy-D-manno-octulosonate 8-phosphate phosphatase (KDO 8-P phosphatase)